MLLNFLPLLCLHNAAFFLISTLVICYIFLYFLLFLAQSYNELKIFQLKTKVAIKRQWIWHLIFQFAIKLPLINNEFGNFQLKILSSKFLVHCDSAAGRSFTSCTLRKQLPAAWALVALILEMFFQTSFVFVHINNATDLFFYGRRDTWHIAKKTLCD